MVKYNLEEANEQLSIDPTDAEAWLSKGLYYLEKEDYKACQHAFSMGLIYEPFHPMLRFFRGRKYTSICDYKMAAAELTLTSRLIPEYWKVWYYLGTSLILDGDLEGCRKAQKQAIKVVLKYNSGCLSAPIFFYWVSSMRLGKVDEAQEMLDKYVNEDMDNEAHIDYLERVLLLKGLREPERFLKADWLKNHGKGDVYEVGMKYGLAQYYYYNNKKEEAKKLLEEVIKYTEYNTNFAYKLAKQELAMMF